MNTIFYKTYRRMASLIRALTQIGKLLKNNALMPDASADAEKFAGVQGCFSQFSRTLVHTCGTVPRTRGTILHVYRTVPQIRGTIPQKYISIPRIRGTDTCTYQPVLPHRGAGMYTLIRPRQQCGLYNLSN